MLFVAAYIWSIHSKITCHFGIFKYIFIAYLDITIYLDIAKGTYLKKSKRQVIWNGGSIWEWLHDKVLGQKITVLHGSSWRRCNKTYLLFYTIWKGVFA
jgi:hypothetical protein